MNNDEQILATLQRLVELQEQTLAIQRQTSERQQEAMANQQKALKHQLATGRIYRISLSILAVGLVLLVCSWIHLIH